MFPFLRRYWNDLVPIFASLVLLLCFLWMLLFPRNDYPTFTIATIGLIIVLITGPIATYTFLKKVRKDKQQQE